MKGACQAKIFESFFFLHISGKNFREFLFFATNKKRVSARCRQRELHKTIPWLLATIPMTFWQRWHWKPFDSQT